MIDINSEGTAALVRRGVSAQTLRLGYVPESGRLGRRRVARHGHTT